MKRAQRITSNSRPICAFALARTQVVSLVACLGATLLYYSSVATTDVVLSQLAGCTLVGSMIGAWLAIFALFLYLIEPAYRCTFWSTQSGYQWSQGFFLDHENCDETRMRVHRHNRRMWASIREDVRLYMAESWERWEEEEPEWFTPAWIARVDDDMIPKAVLPRLHKAGGGKRRRSSLGELLSVQVK